jgi:hypothetical protein
MKCVSCGTKGELYQIESEEHSYFACILCLVNAKNTLKKIKDRSIDEDALYKRLQQITKGVITA